MEAAEVEMEVAAETTVTVMVRTMKQWEWWNDKNDKNSEGSGG
jgi:hypothetical protein